MDQPVVRSRPDQPLHARRFGEGENRGIVLGGRLVEGDRPARDAERRGIVSCEIGGDRRPALPLVHGAEQHVRAGIEHVRVVRGDQERRRPLEAVLPFPGRMPVRTVGPGVDDPKEAGLVIDARQEAGVVPAVRDVGIVGPRLHVSRFPRHVVPLSPIDPGRPAAGPAHAAVVLLRTAHLVGEMVRRRNVVELRGGVVLVAPRLAAIERHVRAAVVPFDHAPWIVGGDPHVVVVAVRIG